MPFFIEVGTCDFDTLEKLAKNGWDGIMIEPVKEYMDKLPKFDNVHYENIAISDIKEDVDIHYINPNKITHQNNEWLKGISAINGSSGPFALQLNKDLDMFKNCMKTTVKTMTLNELCEKYNVTEVDFLKIDTEGHDYRVLKTLDLDKINVRMIKIEHKHLNQQLIIDHLHNHNYITWVETDDIYAVR
tara:strand:- start:16315 stop:16878 length:564 start_codon:yes stop_codon:yes gene_type:complete